MSEAMDIAVRSEMSLLDLAETKAALEKLTAPEDVKEVRDRAEAFRIYAEARGRRSDALIAAEVCLWAEYRAGELRNAMPAYSGGLHRILDYDEILRLRQQGLSNRAIGEAINVPPSSVRTALRRIRIKGDAHVPKTRRDFDIDLGLVRGVGPRWSALARIPRDELSEAIEKAKSVDSELTLAGIRARLRGTPANVELGIDRLADGRFRIRWNRNGRTFRRTLQTRDLRSARAERRRLAVAEPVSFAKNDPLGDAYQKVRRVLSNLDELLPQFGPDRRLRIEKAMHGLYQAEDELGKASRLP